MPGVALDVLQRRPERMRDKGEGKSKSDGSNTERLSHMLPHVRVRRAGTGAALCKCLLAACGTAGEPHMFVLWSSHTGGLGMARLHRTGAFCLEPLVMSVSLSVYFLICLRVHVVSVCLSSTPPIIVFPSLPLLSGSPLAARACSWEGEDQAEAKRGRTRKGGKRWRTDQRCRRCFPADIAEIRTSPQDKY